MKVKEVEIAKELIRSDGWWVTSGYVSPVAMFKSIFWMNKTSSSLLIHHIYLSDQIFVNLFSFFNCNLASQVFIMNEYPWNTIQLINLQMVQYIEPLI